MLADTSLECVHWRGFHILIMNVLFPSPTDVWPQNPQGFKMRQLGRDFHNLTKNALFPFLTGVTPQSPLKVLKRATRERFSHRRKQCFVPLSNPCGTSKPTQGFQTRSLGKGFPTLIRNISFSSPTDVRPQNPSLSGPNVLTSTPPDVWL